MRWTYLKNGETLALDTAACVDCGACVEVCPHGVFAMDGKKAILAYRASCMECGACAKNCPAQALSVSPGVGCAAAIIMGKLRGSAPDCGPACCGSKGPPLADKGARSPTREGPTRYPPPAPRGRAEIERRARRARSGRRAP